MSQNEKSVYVESFIRKIYPNLSILHALVLFHKKTIYRRLRFSGGALRIIFKKGTLILPFDDCSHFTLTHFQETFF